MYGIWLPHVGTYALEKLRYPVLRMCKVAYGEQCNIVAVPRGEWSVLDYNRLRLFRMERDFVQQSVMFGTHFANKHHRKLSISHRTCVGAGGVSERKTKEHIKALNKSTQIQKSRQNAINHIEDPHTKFEPHNGAKIKAQYNAVLIRWPCLSLFRGLPIQVALESRHSQAFPVFAVDVYARIGGLLQRLNIFLFFTHGHHCLPRLRRGNFGGKVI